MSGTKFKDGLVSGDEIKSEGDISTSGSGVKIKANSTSTKLISMHHDLNGGHIDATEKLEINSPSTIVKAGGNNILSGDTTETKLYHSNDGSDRIVTTNTGITVYGSDGVTAKKFKFPILEDDAAAAAGSTADTDFALIQAQKIGTASDEHSVLDFTIGDNLGIDGFRFRFDPSDGSVNSGNEYSLVTIGANTDGCTVMDLTNSHNLTNNAEGTDANSEVKASKFIGEASLLAATVAPSTTTVNTTNSTTAAGQSSVILDSSASVIVGMRIRGDGIAAGTTITDVNDSTNTITLSKNTLANIAADTNLTVETDFGKGLVNNTTNDLDEGAGAGSNNLYYKDSRARNAITLDTIDDTDFQKWPTKGVTDSSGNFCSELLKVAADLSTTPTEFKEWAKGNASDGNKHGDFNGDGSITSADVTIALKLATYGEAADVDAAIITRWVNIIEPALKNESWFIESLTATNPKGVLTYNNTTGELKYKPADLSRILTEVPTASSSTLGLIKIGYVASGNNYAVVLDTNNKAFVNVPVPDLSSYLTEVPTASSSTLGLIKIGYTLPTGDTNRKYPVKLDTDNNAYVNIPWIDTLPNTHAQGLNQGLTKTSNVKFKSLGIGTTASGIQGEILATNNITAYYSDDRLKTRGSNIQNPLEKLAKLNGFHYQANEVAIGLGYEKKDEVGVSAQEVQSVLPEIVVPAPIDAKYLTVHYEKLIPLLIEAIKELKAEVDELKGDI